MGIFLSAFCRWISNTLSKKDVFYAPASSSEPRFLEGINNSIPQAPNRHFSIIFSYRANTTTTGITNLVAETLRVVESSVHEVQGTKK